MNHLNTRGAPTRERTFTGGDIQTSSQFNPKFPNKNLCRNLVVKITNQKTVETSLHFETLIYNRSSNPKREK